MTDRNKWKPASEAFRSETVVPVSSLVELERQARVHRNDLEYYATWYSVYPYPCDDLASERLDLLHAMIYEHAMGDRLFVTYLPPAAPGDRRINVLDIGCGSARWAQEVATRHPDVNVFGMDIGDIHETLKTNQSRNFSFRSGLDFESDDWDSVPPSPDMQTSAGAYDFIRMSMLQGSVSDWPKLLSRAYRLLAPGGILDIIDIDWSPSGRVPATSPYTQLWILLGNATRDHSKPILINRQTREQQVGEAGFEPLYYHCEVLHPRERKNKVAAQLPHSTSREMTAELAGWTRLYLGSPELKFLNDTAVSVLPAWAGLDPEEMSQLAEHARLDVLDSKCPYNFHLSVAFSD